MAEYSEYSFLAAFMTVGLFIIIPLMLVGFGYNADQASGGVVSSIVSGVINFFLNLIYAVIEWALYVIKIIVLGILYIAKVFATGAADTALAEYIDDFTTTMNETIDAFVSFGLSSFDFVDRVIGVYSLIPTPLLVIMFIPLGFVLFRSLVPLIK